MAGARVFVYGTLRNEALLRDLTGRPFPRTPARLEGYERIIPVDGYPYVVARAGAHVDGFLLIDVDPTSLARLDAYEEEGRLYHRRPVEVTAEGSRVACETYVGDVAALVAEFGMGATRPRPHGHA